MKLSVCIITKNEKEKLKRCLEALKGYDVEIVVADTGSTDGTKDMLQEYTSYVYDFAWCDDFSKARNFVAEKASNDMILVLDSDEYIESVDADGMEAFLKSSNEDVGRIAIKNIVKDSTEIKTSVECVSRVYSKSRYHYVGRIHEQLVRIDGKVHNSVELPVVVLHDGYSGTKEEKALKAKRNISLLLKTLKESPKDTYILYQLGKSHYMMGDYEKAVEYFDIALGYDVNPALEYVIDMVETYGYALLNSGQNERALQLEGIYDVFGDCADFKVLMGLIYMNNMLFDLAVEEFLKATQYKSARTVGANSYIAYYNAGIIRECLGDKKAAIEFYKKAGNYKKALDRIALL